MKRHKRDTGGFGKYTLHPDAGAKLPPHMPTPAHLSTAAKAQSSGLWNRQVLRPRLRALGSFPLVACAVSWGRRWPARQQPQLLGAQGLETGLHKVL